MIRVRVGHVLAQGEAGSEGGVLYSQSKGRDGRTIVRTLPEQGQDQSDKVGETKHYQSEDIVGARTGIKVK